MVIVCYKIKTNTQFKFLKCEHFIYFVYVMLLQKYTFTFLREFIKWENYRWYLLENYNEILMSMIIEYQNDSSTQIFVIIIIIIIMLNVCGISSDVVYENSFIINSILNGIFRNIYIWIFLFFLPYLI